jgi:hypothetical protein
MSCWVVPTIAAELWGVPVDQVLQRVRDGNLPYRVDAGFMFVDVAPPPPPTFTVLSEAEVDALADEVIEHLRERDAFEEAQAPEPESETQSPDDDEASEELGDWRAARLRVSRTRTPPGGRRAAPRAA